MNSDRIFQMALGAMPPWEIKRVEFDKKNTPHELHIYLDFKRGSKFADSAGDLCEVYDTKEKQWRHLNFFEHRCYLHCRVPRIKTSSGKVKLINVPWSRQGSGFTLLFEAFSMGLIEREMPVNKVGELLGEDAHRIWTIFNYWIERAYSQDNIEGLTDIGIDETSHRKGHSYVTVAVDLDAKRVIHVTEGKDKTTVKTIKDYIESKDVKASDIVDASMDMSPSYISGFNEYFPAAQIHFDRFHVVKLLNEAMDKVRQLERKEHDELKGHKYTFLKTHSKLSDKKKKSLQELITLFPTLGEAYRLKTLFNDLWDMETEEEATEFLVNWCREVEGKGIAPFQPFINTIKLHWQGIINFCETQISNGILEGINSKIQLAKRRARGYRVTRNFINMIYFLCGKLKFDYPLYSS